MDQKLDRLPGLLLPWYRENRRDLPWRHTENPYHIWISEIMLQQTRVEAVKGYYRRFLEKLPTIEALASCDDDTLNKLWEGLGYYSRVRNMKKAAKVIMDQFDGVFPGDYESILSLPGIGEYTAGAVCSIAFGLPTPAVDGNVLRVLSRLLNDSRSNDSPALKKEYRDILAGIYPIEAGLFTQALMELGATVCGPNRLPECGKCPCLPICQGSSAGTAPALPVKPEKKPRRTEELTVFIMRCGDRFALEKRSAKGLLASMWQFPNVPGTLEIDACMACIESFGLTPTHLHKTLHRQHIFTHILWKMQGVYLDVKEPCGNFTWMTPTEIEASAALPTAFRQFWKETEYV